jgi:hypothetical protein
LDRFAFYVTVPEALPQVFSEKISSGRRPRRLRVGLMSLMMFIVENSGKYL